MQKEDTRNTIIFIVCAMLMLVVYQVFIVGPQAEKKKAELAARAPTAAAAAAVATPQAPRVMTREAAVATTPRVVIDTPALKGSLSLRGGRIDDLFLAQYRETVEKGSPAVELLRPEGAKYPWFAEIGWVGANIAGLPQRDTLWTLAEGSTLAPGRPVTLTYTSGGGLTFTRQIAVDDKYMFTITDTVANTSPQAVTLAPYGSVQRQGLPEILGKNSIVHEGGVGWLGDRLRLLKFAKWRKENPNQDFPSTGGWVGVTDKYWLAALIPGQQERFTGQFRTTAQPGLKVYEADFVGQPRQIPAGRQITETTHFFAGAKQVPVLRAYEKNLGVESLDQSVDWGMFWFLTRPIFSFLAFIQQHVGSFGISILLLTVVVRGLFFPIAQKQYESLTKMKKVQPQMEELRKVYKDDPAKQQQELLALYQREKVNPLAGCLPLLLQIPVFFALYKVLTVTLEMRHAPFLGWIKDLSAPDPTNIWNLFGLIPWDPATAPLIGGFIASAPHALAHAPLHLGVMAIAYGITMWLTTSMSPPAPDPAQQAVFRLMPLIFTFIMAGFPVGLLIYWTWSNCLTCAQQYAIMRRFKVDNPIDRLIRRFTGAPAPTG